MEEETNIGDDRPGNPLWTWVAPLLILLVLIIFGAWFCRPAPAPPKPEASKPANTNTANTNSAGANTATMGSAANSNRY